MIRAINCFLSRFDKCTAGFFCSALIDAFGERFPALSSVTLQQTEGEQGGYLGCTAFTDG
jgi:hypothetical protein